MGSGGWGVGGVFNGGLFVDGVSSENIFEI
jgi:hypothetical protein